MSKKTYSQAQRVQIEGQSFYKIENYHGMRPFLMTLTSPNDHWMFISSNGGLTAGRRNAEYALFPYYTDDKITESAHITGSKTIIRVFEGDATKVWEPFISADYSQFHIERNLYKSELGHIVMFEEINHDLKMSFQYSWSSSDIYGFVRKSKITNSRDRKISLEILDGIQNILPAGVGSDLQNRSSNLVDAYKRSELEQKSGLGIYALSATIVDRAEPSEALKANVVWTAGLTDITHLLSSKQLSSFRQGEQIVGETDIKAEKGAYFVSTRLEIEGNSEHQWYITADVNKNHASIAQCISTLTEEPRIEESIEADINQGTVDLTGLIASADGLQRSSDHLNDTRHMANVMFNVMRGGIFDDNYQIQKEDFCKYLRRANLHVYTLHESTLQELPNRFDLFDLQKLVNQVQDSNLERLMVEYLPIKFSRRHGDPSRPWNKFSINIKNEVDGSKVLDYQGNWRDIFQNWEALSLSFPCFVEGVIYRFLNASTFDGYNPYRLTKDGFDWETIEPDDPWSYIGYWGDHQIIYLLKLLEILEKQDQGRINELIDKNLFVYAAVPYRIKEFEEIIKDPKDTVEFDTGWDAEIRKSKKSIGADGALLKLKNGALCQVNFLEKILATTLAKVSNFIPEAGIWMNTQRPEWNDANNALVGNGVSMVTLYYLRRFLKFFEEILADSKDSLVEISSELKSFFSEVDQIFKEKQGLLESSFTDEDRYDLIYKLGTAASSYRDRIYNQGFSGEKATLLIEDVIQFFDKCRSYLEHSIKANERADRLYHAYNLIELDKGTSDISYLSEMLEGQVAVLSSGYLDSEQVLGVLDALRQSALYRKDQNSYVLYPNKQLPGFLSKNRIPDNQVAKSVLLQKLVSDKNKEVIEKDVFGHYHFNGNFKNINDLIEALESLNLETYGSILAEERDLVGEIFEGVFNHKEFTGRSGTFYGYEGLGSIYWHMVSKLALAVQECCFAAIDNHADPKTIEKLIDHYYEISEGIGVHKSPQLYGAFTTDPYSHTPAGRGAQQPGMTGQVKEDILCRFGELGVFVENGSLGLYPRILRRSEFLSEPTTFHYVDKDQTVKEMRLDKGSLGFTYCQVPIIYKVGNPIGLEVFHHDDTSTMFESLVMDQGISEQIFKRTGQVVRIVATITPDFLR